MTELEKEILISLGVGFLSVFLYYLYGIWRNVYPCKNTQKEIIKIVSTFCITVFVVWTFYTTRDLDMVVVKYKMLLLGGWSVVFGLEMRNAFKMFYGFRNNG